MFTTRTALSSSNLLWSEVKAKTRKKFHIDQTNKTASQSAGSNDSLKDIRFQYLRVLLFMPNVVHGEKTDLLVENQVDIGSQNSPDL
ncbi:hypothetical protein Tco_0557413 [Tanacetum coccineum]